MLPYYLLTWSVVVLVALLCLFRPNLGKIVIGFLYLAAAGALNLSLLVVDAGIYAVFVGGAQSPAYRAFNAATLAVHPVFYLLMLVVFLVALGLLILGGGGLTRIGLIISGLFLIALAPIDTLLYPCLALAAVQLFLLPHRFDGLWFFDGRYELVGAE